MAYTINELVKITPAGVQAASYLEIVEALENEYKNIYGNDIDISNNTADGIFIRHIALMVWNMTNIINTSYSMHDPATATGKYLDILCSFSNIRRILQKNSTCYLYVRIKENTAVTNPPASIIVTDTSTADGTTWIWNNPTNYNGTPSVNIPTHSGSPMALKFTAMTAGKFNPIKGVTVESGGVIDFVNSTHGALSGSAEYDVWQLDDANVGNYDETDDALRSRRLTELTARGMTTLKGIEHAIMENPSIKDCYVVQNSSNSQSSSIITGTTIGAHQVLVVIRPKVGTTIDNSAIANLIYNQLTPGIYTGDVNASGCDLYTLVTYSKSITSSINENIKFGIAKPVDSGTGHLTKPVIRITGIYTDNFSTSSDTATNIKNALLSYLNNLKMTDKMLSGNLINIVNANTKYYNNMPCIMATACSIQYGGSTDNSFGPIYTYYNYSMSDIMMYDAGGTISIVIAEV